MIGVTAAAALFPDEFQLHQLLERCRYPLLTDPQFFGEGLAGKDHKDLTALIDPAIFAGELEAVQKKGVGHLGLQTHFTVAGI